MVRWNRRACARPAQTFFYNPQAIHETVRDPSRRAAFPLNELIIVSIIFLLLIGWAGYQYLGPWLLDQGVVSSPWAELAGMLLALAALPIASALIGGVVVALVLLWEKLLNRGTPGED